MDLPMKRPALIVIDMQNSFVHPEGAIARMGIDMSAPRAAIPTVKRLVDAAHEVGVPVIFTRLQFKPDYSDAGLLTSLYTAMPDYQAMIEGTWDAAIHDDLTPAENDYILDKTRYSAFIKTNLEDILQKEGADGVIMTGVTTNVCVESTARDAFQREYHVVLVSDAVAGNDPVTHNGTLESIKYCIGTVASADEVIDALKKLPVEVPVKGS